MVYSGARRSSQMTSYINGDFGGGSKKAGLPYQIGRTSAITYAFRQTSQNLIILKGRKFELNYTLQSAIKNIADKQTIANSANANFMTSDTSLTAKYNATIALYGDGTQFDDNSDIDIALAGLVSPADDAKISSLNEITAARLVKTNAQTTLTSANQALSEAQSNKDAAQTSYDNFTA